MHHSFGSKRQEGKEALFTALMDCERKKNDGYIIYGKTGKMMKRKSIDGG